MLVKIGEVWVDPDHVVAIERSHVLEQAHGAAPWSVLHLTTGKELCVPLEPDEAARLSSGRLVHHRPPPRFEGDDGR